MRVLLLHGPNLNLLGTRRPDVYGSLTLAELEEQCRAWAAHHPAEVDAFQTNHEGFLIDQIQAAAGTYDGVIINPGALTHYSFSLRDAIEAVAPLPVVEVHLSDIANREEWRRHSVISEVCAATFSGMGPEGYRRALEHLFGSLSR